MAWATRSSRHAGAATPAGTVSRKAEGGGPQIRALLAKAGKTTGAPRRDTKDAGDEKVQVTFDVQFEKGPGEATFGWDGSGAGWELVAFDLHLGKR